MAFELKDGRGTLFRNNRKEAETHADYNGSIKVAGVEYWLNAWLKDGKSGKYFSLSVSPKEQNRMSREEWTRKNEPQRAKEVLDDFKDDIPFS